MTCILASYNMSGFFLLIYSICHHLERRTCFILRCTQHILFMVIWCLTYGKYPLSNTKLPLHGLFLISSKGFLNALSHLHESTYHHLCYTSRGTLDGTRNSTMVPPLAINPTTYRTLSVLSTIVLHLSIFLPS